MNRYCRKKVVDLYVVGTIKELFELFYKFVFLRKKDKLVEYLDKVYKINNDYKTIQDLSVSLKDISTELSESKETIRILQESNDALELKNTNLKND